MQIVYVGPADAVTLAPSAGGIHFPNGVPVEVPDDLGRRLLEQGTFRRKPRLRIETPEKPGSVTESRPGP